MTIKCIAFDLDNTLWDCDSLIINAEKYFYKWLSDTCPKITNRMSESKLVAHRMEYMQAKPELHHNLTKLRKLWMSQIFDEYVSDEVVDKETFNAEFIETGFHVFWHQRNNVVFYDGVLEMLDKLSSNYSLGVITNGNADVNYIGVGDYFDFTMSSEKAGIAKPHEDIFYKAMQLSDHSFDETVYVGDDPTCDVIGPQKLGIQAIWYNPNLKPWPAGKTPAAIFQHHDELEDKISNL